MAALFAVSYAGQVGSGVGAMYVGNGVIAGFDIYGGRYKGTYTEANGRIKGTVTLTQPGGGQLVTGQQIPPGASVQISADWPSDLGNGKPLQLNVGGQPVQVNFNKMVDV